MESFVNYAVSVLALIVLILLANIMKLKSIGFFEPGDKESK